MFDVNPESVGPAGGLVHLRIAHAFRIRFSSAAVIAVKGRFEAGIMARSAADEAVMGHFARDRQKCRWVRRRVRSHGPRRTHRGAAPHCIIRRQRLRSRRRRALPESHAGSRRQRRDRSENSLAHRTLLRLTQALVLLAQATCSRRSLTLPGSPRCGVPARNGPPARSRRSPGCRWQIHRHAGPSDMRNFPYSSHLARPARPSPAADSEKSANWRNDQ